MRGGRAARTFSAALHSKYILLKTGDQSLFFAFFDLVGDLAAAGVDGLAAPFAAAPFAAAPAAAAAPPPPPFAAAAAFAASRLLRFWASSSASRRCALVCL